MHAQEISPYSLASGVTVHIKAHHNETNCCCCSLNDMNVTGFEFHSDNCGCLFSSTNYTIYIEYMDNEVVSNHLFIIPTEKCENMTQPEPTSMTQPEPTRIISEIITSTSGMTPLPLPPHFFVMSQSMILLTCMAPMAS